MEAKSNILMIEVTYTRNGNHAKTKAQSPHQLWILQQVQGNNSTYHALQEPPQLDTVPPSMRSKAKRPGIYQSISSAFSRKSSSSLKSPSSHLPAAPTAENPSLLSIPTNRSQRMYQSISSAFSMMSSNSQEF